MDACPNYRHASRRRYLKDKHSKSYLWKLMGIWLILALLSSQKTVLANLVSVTLETCTAEEGLIAQCGPGANCFIMEGIPTCHCVIDTATGLPLAGNPYKGCTWDISGTWQLFSYIHEETGMSKEIVSPLTNQPFIIRLDRTDAVLRTKYMVGAIFVITAMTSFAFGVCGRAFLDASDNTSILFEHNEGFLDQNGRSILLRSAMQDTTLIKMKQKVFDRIDLKGHWQKNDGTQVRIAELKKPHDWPNCFSEMTRHWSAYWYNDASFSSPILRLSMALFLDKTLEQEQIAFHTSSRFVQTGWYGALRFGSSRIDIYSPADGHKILLFKKKDIITALPGLPLPPGFGSTTTTLTDEDLKDAGLQAVKKGSVAEKKEPTQSNTGETKTPKNLADLTSSIFSGLI